MITASYASLPHIRAPAVIIFKSVGYIGKLSISLSHIEPEANGTQALLHVRLLEGTALPAFHAQLDWGQLDPVSSKPLPSEIHTQQLMLDAPLLPTKPYLACG